MKNIRQNFTKEQEKILAYLDSHPIQNKDEVSPENTKSNVIKNKGRDDYHKFVLDLHGYVIDDASALFRETLFDYKDRGIRSFLVIHGRGLHSNSGEFGVIKKMVRDMLDGELQNYVRNYKFAPSSLGGDGATIVYLS